MIRVNEIIPYLKHETSLHCIFENIEHILYINILFLKEGFKLETCSPIGYVSFYPTVLC